MLHSSAGAVENQGKGVNFHFDAWDLRWHPFDKALPERLLVRESLTSAAHQRTVQIPFATPFGKNLYELSTEFGSGEMQEVGWFERGSNLGESTIQDLLGNGWTATSGITWDVVLFTDTGPHGDTTYYQNLLVGTFTCEHHEASPLNVVHVTALPTAGERNWGAWLTAVLVPLTCCVVLAAASHTLPPGQAMPRCGQSCGCRSEMDRCPCRVAISLLALVSVSGLYTAVSAALPRGAVTFLSACLMVSCLTSSQFQSCFPCCP